MTRTFVVLAACGFLAAAASAVRADAVTFNFTGTVTGVGSDDLGLGVDVGTPITGSYTFDSGASNVNPPGGSASYQVSGGPYGFSATILGEVFQADFLAINVVNNNPDDEYGVLACTGGLSGCFAAADPHVVFNWLMTDATDTAFGSNALPLLPPLLAAFQTNFFELDVLTALGALENVQGHITALTLAPKGSVPEPGSLLLLTFGLGALAFARRRLRFQRHS